jgi:hypothetical protein
MTNDERSLKVERRRDGGWISGLYLEDGVRNRARSLFPFALNQPRFGFGFRILEFFRHLAFVIRHFS